MKLVRFGDRGAERPGAVDQDGGVRDLSGIVGDVDASAISPAGLDRLRAVDLAGLPLVPKRTRLGVPVAGVANLVCIGLNYTDHAEETNAPIPTQPILFNKHTMALSGPYDDVILPPGSTPSSTGRSSLRSLSASDAGTSRRRTRPVTSPATA
jgi:2,4-didehydro-3-deoxy-L-rhamnonate hydrolase